MYPLRGLIYAALLVASFLDPVDGVNAMERSDQLQRILELAPAGSVSMEEVENVLNDTRIEIPRLVQPAKGTFSALLLLTKLFFSRGVHLMLQKSFYLLWIMLP